MISVIVCAAALVITTTHEMASLCVQVEGAAESAVLGEEAVVLAMRARIPKRQVKVGRCATMSSTADWRLFVRADNPDVATWQLDGAELHVEGELATMGLRPYEVAQRLALSASEAVRPSMEALLARLDVASILIEEKPQEAPPPAARRIEMALALGPRMMAGRSRATPYAELAVCAMGQTLGPCLHVAGERLTPRTRDGVELRGEQIEAGLAVVRAWPWGQAGLAAQSRLTQLHLRAASDMALRSKRPRFWNGGASLSLEAWPLKAARWRVGLTARVAWWWQPRRFLYGEQTLLRQTAVDVVGGLLVRWPSF